MAASPFTRTIINRDASVETIFEVRRLDIEFLAICNCHPTAGISDLQMMGRSKQYLSYLLMCGNALKSMGRPRTSGRDNCDMDMLGLWMLLFNHFVHQNTSKNVFGVVS